VRPDQVMALGLLTGLLTGLLALIVGVIQR
jgi:thiamine transporter ThiT